jgi:signal transduction histidine kinase/CheY-like chemotaxis protein
VARRLRSVAAGLDEARVLAETVAAARELLAADRASLLLPGEDGLAPWRPGEEPLPALAAPLDGGTCRELAAGVARLGGAAVRGAIPCPDGAAVALAVGLSSDDADGPLGVLVVGRTAPRAFSVDDEAILAELGAHAGAAVGRARRHQAALRRAERLGTLVRLGQRLAEPRPPATLLRLIAEQARALLGASAAACRLVAGPELSLAATAGEAPALAGPERVAVGAALCGQVVAGRAAILVADTARADTAHPAAARELAARGVRSYLGVPLVVRDAVAAVLSVYATGAHRFGEDDAALLAAFVGPASVALESGHLRRELLDAERLSVAGRIVAGVAHELNNPLAVVIGTAELLRKEVRDPQLLDRLHRIGEQARRAVKIVRSLLALARREPAQRVPVDLPPLLDETLDLQGYELRSLRIAVVRRYEPGLPPVLAEATQLQQLFTNLVLDAVQAMRDTGRAGSLTVSACHDRAQDRVRVAVAGEGPGIAPPDLERVFEAFHTTKPAGLGTGLGLAFSRQIVEAHGGWIRAEKRPGGGACFVVEVPAHRGAATAVEPSAGSVRPRAGARALLVEDERVVGDLLAEFLAIAGYDVDRAANGRAALEHVRRRAYALIVSDVRMPDVDGPALYHELLAVAPDLARRMVFVTGDIMSPEIRRFLDQTCLRYLEKPFTLAEFQGVIRGVVEPSAVGAEPRASGA